MNTEEIIKTLKKKLDTPEDVQIQFMGYLFGMKIKESFGKRIATYHSEYIADIMLDMVSKCGTGWDYYELYDAFKHMWPAIYNKIMKEVLYDIENMNILATNDIAVNFKISTVIKSIMDKIEDSKDDT